jgi:uncharacterized repeat protein (TIGR01451 family)
LRLFRLDRFQIKKHLGNKVLTKAPFIAAALMTLVFFPDSSLAWPTTSEWIPVLRAAAPVTDDPSDAQGGKNMVGDATHPTAYISCDGIDIFFRMRLDDTPLTSPRQPGNDLISFGWGVEFETDGDPSTYEWLIMVDGIANEEIHLEQNTTTAANSLNDPGDTAEIITKSYNLVFGSNVRVIPAGSYLGSKAEEDYFLDWSIPLADMTSTQTTPVQFPGLTDDSLLGLIFGTSNDTKSISADIAGTDDTLSGGFSDPVTIYGQTPTTGAVAFVTDATGASTTTTAYIPDDVYVRVIDPDRNSLADSRQSVTVTLTTSTGDTLVLTLTETGNDTGIFVGAAVSAYNATPDTADSSLQVIQGSTVDGSYTEYTGVAVQATRTAPQLTMVSPITISKAASSATALVGDTITYTISVTNASNAAMVVTRFTDTLPAGFAYAPSSTGGDFTALEPSVSGTTLAWDGFTIPIIGTATMTHTFDATTGGAKDSVYTNDASVYGTNFSQTTVSATAPVTIIAPLVEITKAVDLANANPGDILTYSLSYKNNGTATAATVVLIDAAPAYTIYQVGSMRIGPSGATYATAEALTDADGDGEVLTNVSETVTAKSDGTNIEITVENLPVAGSGITYFKVQIQ